MKLSKDKNRRDNEGYKNRWKRGGKKLSPIYT